ncbi:hypothetical protein N7507_008592 [Penicillium longicatenatum]|nr:hypothetical protein N7507_008592 [Penicillium longicatenatum]
MPPRDVLTQENMDFLWICFETSPMPEWDVVAGKMGVNYKAAYNRYYRLRNYYAARKKEGKAFVDGTPALTPTSTPKPKAGEKRAENAEADDDTELDDNTAKESEDDAV